MILSAYRPRGMDQADGHIQFLLKAAAEEIGNGGKRWYTRG